MEPKWIAITQRVRVITPHHERNDALDQAWGRFLRICGLRPLLLPNHPRTALDLMHSVSVSGLILTGGNDPAHLGGDAPERDETEFALLRYCETRSLPVLGVCRGMQMMAIAQKAPLIEVQGHITAHQEVIFDGTPEQVNAYHHYAVGAVPDGYEAAGRSADGVLKAMRHTHLPWLGIMWHPERFDQPRQHDIALLLALLERGQQS